jgi:hypothetical protein
MRHVTALAALESSTAWLGFMLVVLLLAGLVVWPAIWSTKASRRKAAADVLDRLLRAVTEILDRLPRWKRLEPGRPGPGWLTFWLASA